MMVFLSLKEGPIGWGPRSLRKGLRLPGVTEGDSEAASVSVATKWVQLLLLTGTPAARVKKYCSVTQTRAQRRQEVNRKEPLSPHVRAPLLPPGQQRFNGSLLLRLKCGLPMLSPSTSKYTLWCGEKYLKLSIQKPGLLQKWTIFTLRPRNPLLTVSPLAMREVSS